MFQVVENKMEAQQFCYWLQGFAELNNGVPPNEMQWKAIRDHLALVFEKKTPPYNVPTPRDPNYPSLGPDWQKDIIKDWKPAPPPVYTNPPPNYIPGYQIICSAGTTTNTQSMSIC